MKLIRVGLRNVVASGDHQRAREADTIDRLMSEMTVHRFRHMPVVERGRLIGLVSIGDVVKMHIAGADMEAAATREYAA